MSAHDDELIDLVAVLALGALPEVEARRVAAHMETCAECRALFASLRPAADLIGYSAEAATLDEVTSARMKARLMRAVRASDGTVGAPRTGRRPAIGWFAAAAAVLVAASVAFDDVSVRARAERSNAANLARVAALQNEAGATRSSLLALLPPGGRHFAVPQGEVVTNAGRVLVALKLAALPQGKVYQAWTLAKGAKAVSPSITFTPGAGGVAVVELPVDATGLAAVAVSVEPAGGSKAPTSAPNFVRKLS